jgi:hypothetical protein
MDSELTPTEITKKCTAIVKFGPAGFATDGFRPAEYFQVTIDPQKISPSGEFIRFGGTDGDEIMGWQRAAAISVVEILGEWDSEESPTFKYGAAGQVTMPVLNKGD